MASCCGPPTKCCSCTYYPPKQPDECRCGCGYHNGVFQVLFAQFLLFCGFWFSLAVMGDCSFVEVVEPIQVRQDGVMATRLGLLSYTEMDTGQCYFWNEAILTNTTGFLVPLDGEKQLQYYVRDVLGSQWYPSIVLASTVVVLSLLWFIYVTSYCCSTQVRGVRFFTGFMIALVFVTIQGLTFLVLATNWCVRNQCVTSRTAGFTYASCVSFFLSGCAFFFMSNYPGERLLAKLREEHHRHVMAGDEETQPYIAALVGIEERQDEPPDEGLLPGDKDYEAKEEDIEKILTKGSADLNEAPEPQATDELQGTADPSMESGTMLNR